MTREQMIAWLTLEGWVYYNRKYVDGFARGETHWMYTISRTKFIATHWVENEAPHSYTKLHTADIAVFIEHAQALHENLSCSLP